MIEGSSAPYSCTSTRVPSGVVISVYGIAWNYWFVNSFHSVSGIVVVKEAGYVDIFIVNAN